jgi:ABC-type transport system involved in multi-copper enzyme maturation permease subunit
VSTLFAVLTRSSIVSILVTVLVWFALFSVGQVYQLFSAIRKFNDPPWRDQIASWVFTGADAVHFVLPRTSDLAALNTQLVAEVMTDNDRRMIGLAVLPDINLPESITVSLIFIGVMLALASWRFSRKDF